MKFAHTGKNLMCVQIAKMQQQKIAKCAGALEFWPNHTCASDVLATEN